MTTKRTSTLAAKLAHYKQLAEGLAYFIATEYPEAVDKNGFRWDAEMQEALAVLNRTIAALEAGRDAPAKTLYLEASAARGTINQKSA